MTGRATPVARAEALLAHQWWQPTPTPLAQALRPLAWLYGWLAEWNRRHAHPRRAPVPTLVVGNLVVGGAGKTPTVIALVQALRAAGHRPGVISRGHGRRGHGARAVQAADAAAVVGDEPLLIRRRTGAPVWVGRDRIAAARGLCAQHPDVDVLVADDGLQHHALAPDGALVVFDERGVGNGLLLPAGPLREQLPLTLPPRTRVVYVAARASTALAGLVVPRVIERAWPLAGWWTSDEGSAVALSSLRGRALWAAAGLAAPQKFFSMLQAHGLQFVPLPLPDHHPYLTLPWSADATDVLVTEKDAVKLDPQRPGATRVWVVPLDLQLPPRLMEEVLAWLPAPAPEPTAVPPPP